MRVLQTEPERLADTAQAGPAPSTSNSTAVPNVAVLQAIGVVCLLGIALIHFVQIVDTFNSAVWLGIAFLVLVAASIVATLLLIGGNAEAAWAAAAAIAAGALLGYVFTRSVSTPFDNQDVGNWGETLGLAALFLESFMLALAAYAIAVRHRSV